jgi:hypothetical protein
MRWSASQPPPPASGSCSPPRNSAPAPSLRAWRTCAARASSDPSSGSSIRVVLSILIVDALLAASDCRCWSGLALSSASCHCIRRGAFRLFGPFLLPFSFRCSSRAFLLFLLLSRCSSLAVLACSFISVLLRHPQQKCSSQKCSSPEDKSFLRHGRHAVFLSLQCSPRFLRCTLSLPLVWFSLVPRPRCISAC